MKKKVGLISYKAGNIFSISNSVKYIGYEIDLITSKDKIRNYDYLIFPGVGSFGHCVNNLKKQNLYNPIKSILKKTTIPTLCICVGMQMLGIESEESKNTKGLGVIKFKVSKIKGKKGLKVPHVGWNEVKFSKKFGSFEKNKKYDFYFDHSYSIEKSIFSIGKTCHSHYFESIINYKNILACQFHPEKSQENGLEFLKTFFSTYA